MPTRNLKLPKAPNLIVTLGEDEDERRFRMVRVTLDVEEKLEECATELERVQVKEGSTPIERIEAVIAQLDVLLEPMDGNKLLPSQILLPAYKENKVAGSEIRALVDNMVAEARPT